MSYRTPGVGCLVLVLLTWSCITTSVVAQRPPRTWTSADGGFATRAVLLKRVDQSVHLRKDDGNVVVVPLDRLSAADQAYIRTLESPALGPDFDVENWLTRYAAQPVPMGQWKARSQGVFTDWFDGKSPKCAAGYYIHWGPLGIRTRMCDQTWATEEAFRRRWPGFLTDSDGELLVNCFEVVEVWPGSPADGHLQAGDYLLAMDGQPFLSAMAVETPIQYKHQGERGLELHAGLLLDAAEGRGKVSFKVLRPPQWTNAAVTAELNKDKRLEELDVDVAGANMLRLRVQATDSIDSGWANWLQPRLEGPGGKSLDLSAAEAVASKTGWGKIRRGISAGGEPIRNGGRVVNASIGTHANSTIDYRVPDGFTRFKTTLQLGSDKSAGLRGSVQVRSGVEVTQPPPTWRAVARRSFPRNSNQNRAASLRLKVALQDVDRIRLIVDDGGDGIHNDSFDWLGIRLRDGNRVLRLDQLQPLRKTVGWGEIKTEKSSGNWHVHAHSHLEFMVPQGEWVLTGTGHPADVGATNAQVQVHSAKLPTEIQSLCREVGFEIPKIGAFAAGFPANCQKSANTVAMMASWLARQQQADGSWPRPHGYTGNHYDTSWAALALMATGDKQFEPHIRRAVEFVAFSGKHDAWAIPSSSALLFLSEYWLRYRDDQVLPAIEVWVQRITGEMVYGDQTAGHGHNPGYRGSGVSVGGAATVIALAVTEKTPVRVPQGLVSGMLARGQELGPNGFLPYGRMAETNSFTPDLKSGGGYSGRHGPYLIASLIHGGPKLFTQNCSAMYTKGPVGGLDQGHSTQTMSLMWGIPAVANVDLEAYHQHLESLKWKLTMLRCFDGGYAHNSYRLEFQDGELQLDFAIRTACYLIALCAERKNLAITGAPEYRAQSLVDILPTKHRDASTYRYYLSNWAVAEAALGDKAPDRLSRGVATLREMRQGPGLGDRVLGFLRRESPQVAAQLLALESVEPLLRNYLAEMVIGIDHRISVVNLKQNAKPVSGRYEITLTSQHAGGPMLGEISFRDSQRKFDKPVKFAIEPFQDVDWKEWQTREQKVVVNGPKQESFDLQARIKYRIGRLQFDYLRPIRVGAYETWGNGEKDRTVVNDRRVWVPGKLIADHTRWNLSFRLPSGVVVPAGTQGNSVMVHDQTGNSPSDWISPESRTLLAGSQCKFCFTSGWHKIECRVPEVKLLKEGTPQIVPASYSVDASDHQGDPSSLGDRDPSTALKLEFPPRAADNRGAERNVSIQLQLSSPQLLRSLDVRLRPSKGYTAARMIVDAQVDGQWRPVYWGRVSFWGGKHDAAILTRIVATKTDRVRVSFYQPKWKTLEIATLRLYGSADRSDQP